MEFLPGDNAVGGFIFNERTKFGGGGRVVPRVFMVWGLKAQDLGSCGLADLECDGSQNYIKDPIDMNDAGNQQKLQVLLHPFTQPHLLRRPCIPSGVYQNTLTNLFHVKLYFIKLTSIQYSYEPSLSFCF